MTAELMTRGRLPASAFEHLDPTAVGIIDLEKGLNPSAPDGGAFNREERDAIVLLRLHGEPLTVLHLDRPPNNYDDEQLARQIWSAAATKIAAHFAEHHCGPVPAGGEPLAERAPIPSSCAYADRIQTPRSAAVVLCTVGQRGQLRRCISSLLAQQDIEPEIIVVDNRPATSETARAIEPFADCDRVRYVAEWRAGLSVARNRGVAEADADFVAFTDDDVVLDPGWLKWLLAPFADPGVMVSSGMMMPLELRTPAQKRFEQYLGFSKGVKRQSYDLHSGANKARPLYPFLVDAFGSGASMAFRRAELCDAGGFDPALGAGTPTHAGEETYVFAKMILAGGRIVYEPRAICWHEHHQDGASLREQVFGYGIGVGASVTKALTREPSFYTAAIRSLPYALRSGGRRPVPLGATHQIDDTNSRELARARREGLLRGPLRYVQGARRSHRLRLRNVIRGG
jgi:O-antigen biosynthesis protein